MSNQLSFQSWKINSYVYWKQNLFDAKKIFGSRIKNSEKSEELRVLYVALTRAREELHMICTEKNMANYINKMGAYISDTEKISPYAVSSANKISDWLIMCGLIQTDGSELRKIGIF